jgi:excisionase family DNA binding protein
MQDTKEPARRRTLTVVEAAEILGIGRNQAYRAARDGDLPVIRIGNRILVVRDAFEQMLAAERAAG